MVSDKKIGKKSLKGLRAKYGGTVRKQYSRIFFRLKAKRKCPSCGSMRLGREVSGIWLCRTCGFKIAGGAYELEGSSQER